MEAYNCSDVQDVLRNSLEALAHAAVHQYYNKLTEAVSSSGALLALSRRESISAVERALSHDHVWVVTVHFSGRRAAESLRQRQPSHFVRWPYDIRCDPQVHVLDAPIFAKRYCQLVTFRTEAPPDDTAIDHAISALRSALDANGGSRVTATKPIPKGKQAWFRADGEVHVVIKDRILGAALRTALIKRRSSGQAKDGSIIDLTQLLSQDRQPVNYVLWIRQSNEDAGRAQDSAPRQIATLISSPVLEALQRNDCVIVVAEICSSSKHPLTDRRLYHTLPRNRPMQILTVNPDRLTRRADEVDTILDDLESVGGAWYTSGLELGEDDDKRDWHHVSDPSVDDIKARLKLGRNELSVGSKIITNAMAGRQRALQMGFYWRSGHSMVRVNEAVLRSDRVLPQLKALHDVLALTIRVHDFQNVLICVRISPKSAAAEDQSLQTSLVRQQTFLKNCLGEQTVTVEHLVGNHVSAYNDDFVDMLLERLKSSGGKTLVLSAATDRITRSTEQFERLKNAVVGRGHSIVSFLWDHRTDLTSTTALNLPHGQRFAPEVLGWDANLAIQKRSPPTSLVLPLVQPIMWILGTETEISNTMNDHIERHIRNAQEWVQSGALTSYQGEAYSVSDQLAKGTERGFTQEAMQKWETYIGRYGIITLGFVFESCHKWLQY